MQPKSDIIVNIQNLSLCLKKYQVLKNINLQVSHGDKVGLIGPNGSGKTSLLRVLAGIYKDVQFDTYQNDINYFFLSSPGTVTSPFLNIINNIKRIFYFYKIHQYDQNNLNLLLEEFQLTQYLYYKLSELSQGYQLRVQIVAYLMMNFQNALIDEFFGFGDKFVMEKFENQLADKLHQTSSLIIASHNMDLIHKFCNRIIEIDNGSIINDYRIENPK